MSKNLLDTSVFDILIWTIIIIAIIRIIKLCTKKARFRYGCWKAEIDFNKLYIKYRKKGIYIDAPPSDIAYMSGEEFYLYGLGEEKLKLRDGIIYYAVKLIIWLLMIVLFMSYVGQCTPRDLDKRADEALEYCKENGYNTDYCLLVDYGRHSGKVRFFIWDFEKEKPVLKSLCAHGYGKGSTARRPVFSNEIGSFCSSLGHYRVGREKIMSKPKDRKALVLYGQDKTNSNALQRGILIHPVSLPNFPIYPLLMPVKVHKVFGHKIRPKSEGCITIPFRKYEKVVEIVESSSKPLMLWVYK